MKETEVVLLLSGGIDSTTLLAYLNAQGCKVHALSFDYGQRHLIELEFAKRNGLKYNVKVHHFIDIDYSSNSRESSLTNPEIRAGNFLEVPIPNTPNDTYVPGRNLLMLSYAAAYAESHKVNDIYFAANVDDSLRFPDCSLNFIHAVNEVWQQCPNTNGIQVIAPFIYYTKTEVISHAHQLGVDLSQTISCYDPIGGIECGKCLSCVLKNKAIEQFKTDRIAGDK